MSDKIVMTLKQHLFREFGKLSKKFHVSEVMNAKSKRKEWTERQYNFKKKDGPRRAGVYVFWHGSKEKIVKIGKSRDDAYQRALQHVRENTTDKGGMHSINEFDPLLFVCFNIINENEVHWVLALEDFFERELDPIIKSDRLC